MNPIETAVTAAFVMEGLTSFCFGQVQETWQTETREGAVELVGAIMAYVPAVLAMRAAGDAVRGQAGDNPGAFHDEVSVPLGQWLSCQIIDGAGVLPEREAIIDQIAALVRGSFIFAGQPDRDAHAAIDAVAAQLAYAGQ